MIVKVSGWERSYKTGLAAYLATQPEQLNSSLETFDIKQGFGNLHLFKTPYPWIYLNNSELIIKLSKMATEHITNTLFLIDEADDVFPARDYGVKEQKEILRKLTQHGKLKNVILYTYQEGDPTDPLLGVDRILRSLTRLKITITYFNKKKWFLLYKIEDLRRRVPVKEGIIRNLDKYLEYWNTDELVV